MEMTILLLILAGFVAYQIMKSRARSRAATERNTALAAFDAAMDSRFGFEKKRWHADGFTAIALDPTSGQLAYAQAPGFEAKFVMAELIMSVTVYEDERSVTHSSRVRQIGAAYVGNKIAGTSGAIIGGLGARQHSEDVVQRVTLRVELDDPSKPVVDVDFLTATAPRASFYHEQASREAREWSALLTGMIRATEKKTSTTPPVIEAGTGSRLELLAKLGELRASGILTPEEFEREKARVLESE